MVSTKRSGDTRREWRGAVDRARERLMDVLSEGEGGVSVKEIRSRAEGEGMSWRTVERAKYELGVTAIRASKGWVCQMAERPPTAS